MVEISGTSKIWGNSDGVYFVGTNGMILHYTGSPNGTGTWRRLESGTDVAIQDIWGDGNEVLAIASNVLSFPRERELLRITGTSATRLSDAGLALDLSSIWFMSQRRYCIVGDGTFWKKSLNEQIWDGGSSIITTWYENSIRGTSLNNIFIAGAYGELLHFNGVRWKSFRSQTALAFGQYYAVSTKGNLVVAVGQEYPRATVVRGTRSP